MSNNWARNLANQLYGNWQRDAATANLATERDRNQALGAVDLYSQQDFTVPQSTINRDTATMLGEVTRFRNTTPTLNSGAEEANADKLANLRAAQGIADNGQAMQDRSTMTGLIQEYDAKEAAIPDRASGDRATMLRQLASYAKNNAGDGIHQLLTFDLFRRLNEAGLAYRHVLLDDALEKGRLPPHKLYVVTNVLVLDDAQRTALLARFKEEKAAVVWLYGPGIYYPDNGPSAANLSKLLGVEFKQLDQTVALQMTPTAGFETLAITNSGAITSSPWFLPVGGFDKVIAVTATKEPAMVSFKRDGAEHYFAAVPNLSPAILRRIAVDAGVWSYGDTGDPIQVGNDFVVLHTKTDGEKSLRIPDGMALKAVFGPLAACDSTSPWLPSGWLKAVFGPRDATLKPGDTFTAVAGRTYGFQVIKQ